MADRRKAGRDGEDVTISDKDLVIDMMRGVRSDPPWRDYVRSLRGLFQGNYANLIFRRMDSRTQFSTDDGVITVPDMVGIYLNGFASLDPIPYYSMAPFRAYAIEDFLGDTPPSDHPFTRDFLYPADMRQLMICKVQTPDRLRAWLTVTRPAQPVFTDADRTRFEEQAHLLAHALELFGALRAVEDQRDAYVRLARSRATGLLQIDQNGLLLHADAAAHALLESGDFISVRRGRLRAVDPDDGKRIGAALDRVLDGTVEEAFVVLQGQDDNSLEMLLYRVQEPLEALRVESPRAIIYLCLVGRETGPSPVRLRQLFGLTEREAALTVLLARGLTVADAAVDLGIADQTARTYLRQIFLKTGTNRQAELIRRVMGSIAGMV